MLRERALKVALVLVGLLFSAAVYPAIGGLLDPAHSDTGDTMMMSLYFALAVFLLTSARNPGAHRSLISFAAWSSFAHAARSRLLAYETPVMAQWAVGKFVASWTEQFQHFKADPGPYHELPDR
jgi:Family of unknown function (DUF6632)